MPKSPTKVSFKQANKNKQSKTFVDNFKEKIIAYKQLWLSTKKSRQNRTIATNNFSQSVKKTEKTARASYQSTRKTFLVFPNKNTFSKKERVLKQSLPLKQVIGAYLLKLAQILVIPCILLIWLLWKVGKWTYRQVLSCYPLCQKIGPKLGFHSFRQGVVHFSFVVCFLSIVIHLAQLQVFTQVRIGEKINNEVFWTIIPSKRGEIYIQDISRNKKDIAVTSSQFVADIDLDPVGLQETLDRGIELSEIVEVLAGSLNISYPKLYEQLKTALERNELARSQNSTLIRSIVIQKFATLQQRQAVRYLRSQNLKSSNHKSFAFWNILPPPREKAIRSYPENKLMASTIGYVSKFELTPEEAKQTQCRSMVEENEARRTNTNSYLVGFYGLEQKYCSLLAGLNGKTLTTLERHNERQNLDVVHGANLYLTIDINLQKKAEEILEKAVKDNTNHIGGPKNGAIIVMNPQTGKILALASYPFFDPNNYNDPNTDISAFRNYATSVDYEVGSTMKPLTVAAALTEYQTGNLGSRGQRLGVPPNWTTKGYDEKGKPYEELNGNKVYISNSQNIGFENQTLGLKETIRDSINTAISDIVDTMGTEKMREYFEQKFLFDKPTQVAFTGGGSGNLINIQKSQCYLYCFSQHGFGQGFYIAPIQLMRAFTAITNNGNLVEPYLIEKIVYSDGTVDDGSNPQSIIARPKPYPILTPQSARLVTEYMKAVIDEGYLGQNPYKYSIPGYSVAAKTGTAQVARPIELKDENGKPIMENGRPKLQPCDYICNTKRGIYDHSVIGFAPTTNPQVMVMVKLAEPQPGKVINFAESTTMKPFRDMMQFALEYLEVPKDR